MRAPGRSPFALYGTGVRSGVQRAGLPYGYTVTMWSSGQVLIHFDGSPSLGLVAVFAAGALAGYWALQAAVRHADAREDLELGASPSRLRAGAIQAVAVGLTLAVVAAAASLPAPALSWAIGGMATVAGYLGIVGLELALQARADERREMPRSARAHPREREDERRRASIETRN